MNQDKQRLNESWQLSEILFALSGILILASAPLIYFTQDFSLWAFAKVFYAFALILFIKYA